jgi:hypothetical protein
VRDYWNRQFAAISSKVEPEGLTKEADGSTTVEVHQVLHDARTGDLISDSRVRHRYRFVDGLVVRMDILEPPDRQYGEVVGWTELPTAGNELHLGWNACSTALCHEGHVHDGPLERRYFSAA